MKKRLFMILAVLMLLSMTACGQKPPESTEASTTELETVQETEQETARETVHSYVEIMPSPDKYTWYLKDYYGKNLASIGDVHHDRSITEDYGAGEIRFVLYTPNGEYVDVKNKDSLKKWWVIGQSIAPNTQIKYIFRTDDDGMESDYYVLSQNIEEVILALAPVGERAEMPAFTQIKPSPDQYTKYVYDYVGRNLTQCGIKPGYGGLYQQQGQAEIHLIVNGENGYYVDDSDWDDMKNYVVTRQNIAPNTEIKLTYRMDDDGTESQYYIQTQSVEEIELYAARITEEAADFAETDEFADNGEGPAGQGAETSEDLTEEAEETVDPEFKATMDSCEAFFKEYAEFMKKYLDSDDPSSMMTEYVSIVSRYTETMEALDEIDTDDLSDADMLYYMEVMLRIQKELAGIQHSEE